MIPMVTSKALTFTGLAVLVGFVVPVLPALIALAMAGRLAVTRFIVTELGGKQIAAAGGRPSIVFLLIAAVLGSALLLWFYIDNESLHGRLLVFIGVPIALMAGCALGNAVAKKMEVPTVQGKVTTGGAANDKLTHGAPSVADNAIEVSLNPLGSHPTPWRNNALHIDDASTVHHVQHGEGVASNVNNKFIQAIAMGA